MTEPLMYTFGQDPLRGIREYFPGTFRGMKSWPNFRRDGE